MFGLRDRFGTIVCDPLGGVPLGFATEEEARAAARLGDQVFIHSDQPRPKRRRKTRPLPPA
jgi:hypothetical protein